MFFLFNIVFDIQSPLTFHMNVWRSLSVCAKNTACNLRGNELKLYMNLGVITRRSNQSILREINPECSLEGLMLKLKLKYFGHLMRRANPSEKTLTLAPQKKSYDQPRQHIKKQRHYSAKKGPSSQSYCFDYGFSSSHAWM